MGVLGWAEYCAPFSVVCCIRSQLSCSSKWYTSSRKYLAFATDTSQETMAHHWCWYLAREEGVSIPRPRFGRYRAADPRPYGVGNRRRRSLRARVEGSDIGFGAWRHYLHDRRTQTSRGIKRSCRI